MSWDKLHADVRRRRGLSGNAKVIFAWLVPLVVRGVHPGTRVISDECGCSRGAAIRALEQLRDAGLLSWTKGRSGAGRRYAVTCQTGPETGPGGGTETGPVEPDPKRDRTRNGTGPETEPVGGTETGPGVDSKRDRSPVPKRDHNQTTRPIQTKPDGARAGAPDPAPPPVPESPPSPPTGAWLRRRFAAELEQRIGWQPELVGKARGDADSLARRYDGPALDAEVDAFGAWLVAQRRPPEKRWLWMEFVRGAGTWREGPRRRATVAQPRGPEAFGDEEVDLDAIFGAAGAGGGARA